MFVIVNIVTSVMISFHQKENGAMILYVYDSNNTIIDVQIIVLICFVLRATNDESIYIY